MDAYDSQLSYLKYVHFMHIFARMKKYCGFISSGFVYTKLINYLYAFSMKQTYTCIQLVQNVSTCLCIIEFTRRSVILYLNR